MRIPSFITRGRVAAPVYGILGVGAAVLSSTAQVVNLSENNALVTIDPTHILGMNEWRVDGIDHLHAQTLFYRIGNTGPESPLSSLAYGGAVQPFADQATLSWSGTGFDIEIQYALTGGSIGSGVSDIAEAIKVINTSGSALDFHLFLYTDFDLAGTTGGDTASVNYFGNFPPSLAGYDRAVQTEGPNLAEVTVFEHSARAEVDTPGVLGGKLTNLIADNLASSGVSATNGPGDMAFAFQWDLNVGNGSFEVITVDKRLDVVPIPEPTTAALSLLGLVAFFHASRRRRV